MCLPKEKNSSRVYFELLMELPKDLILEPEELQSALQAEGCMVAVPRYPLLHEQPYFTEGKYKDFARLRDESVIPTIERCSYRTQSMLVVEC